MRIYPENVSDVRILNHVMEFIYTGDRFLRIEIGRKTGFASYTPLRSLVIWNEDGEASHLRWDTIKNPDLRLSLMFYPELVSIIPEMIEITGI